MKTTDRVIVMFAFLVTFLGGSLLAQDYVGKQRTIELKEDAIMTLMGDQAEDTTPELIGQYFFNLPVEKMLTRSKNMGIALDVTETNFSISGERFRIDEEENGNKISYIIDLKGKKFYRVVWAEKQYMEMSLDAIKQMQKQAEQALKKMEGMQEMMAQLPPEAREQLKRQMGMAGAKPSPPTVKRTGKQRTIHGFPCEEILVEGATSREQIWATRKFPALRKSFESIMRDFPQFTGPDEEEKEWEIWKQIPNSWPVLSKKLSYHPMKGGTTLEIEEALSFEEKKLPPGTFQIPSGFVKRDFMEMMR